MNQNNLKLYLLLILTMTLWGGGWIVNKLIVYEANIIVLTFWRFFITFLTFIPIVFILKIPIVINKKALQSTTMAAILNSVFMIMAFLGVMEGFASRAGVIVTTLSPIITFLLVSFFFSYKLQTKHIFGLIFGLIGGMFMFEIWRFNLSDILVDGNLYFIICAFLWAFVTMQSQRAQQYMNPFIYTLFLTAIASIVLFIFALPYDIWIVFQKDLDFWLALIYLAFLGQTVATTIYYYASGKLGSTGTSSFLFIVPVSALFFGWLILDEEPTFYLIIGGTISIFALYIINKKTN